MKPSLLIGTLLLIAAAPTTWAYGSSSSTKSCEKPQFANFVPTEKSEVSAGSQFSFTASGVIDPKSIKVNVKNQPVELSIDEKGNTYSVSGKLPENLTGTHARIAISAEGKNRCKGTGGWLIKITE